MRGTAYGVTAVCAVALWVAISAAAEVPSSPVVSGERVTRTVSADPNAPTVRYGWLGAIRARGSAPIQLMGTIEEPGFLWMITPLIELHNSEGHPAPFPFEYWRGRLMMEAGYRFDVNVDPFGAMRLSASALLEHESDHPSVQPGSLIFQFPRPTAYKYMNDIALRLAVTWPIDQAVVGIAVIGRLDFASCTLRDRICEEFEFRGANGHANLDLTFDSAGASTSVDWALFAAAHFEVVAASERTISEHRVAVQSGIRMPTEQRGTFAVYLAGLFGSELGFLREERVAMVGFFGGWTP